MVPLVLPCRPKYRHSFPVEAVVLELLGQGQVGPVIFGRDEQAAGVPVNPVDDPRPKLAIDAGQALAAVKEQRVDQGAVGVAGGGVDHHAHRLIDLDHVLILIDHLQGDVLGQELHWGGVGNAHGDLVPRLQPVILFQGPALAEDMALLQEFLGRGP